MWNFIKKIIDWFKESNRIQHLSLGYLCGWGANDWYCAVYGGVGVSGALEFKDWKYGKKPDLIDFILTLIGFLSGYFTRSLIW